MTSPGTYVLQMALANASSKVSWRNLLSCVGVRFAPGPVGLRDANNTHGADSRIHWLAPQRYRRQCPHLHYAIRLSIHPHERYGFAHAKAEAKTQWTELAEHYFSRKRASEMLGTVCLVVDARQGLKQTDRDFLGSLGERSLPFRIVLTKADLVDQVTLAKMCVRQGGSGGC